MITGGTGGTEKLENETVLFSLAGISTSLDDSATVRVCELEKNPYL